MAFIVVYQRTDGSSAVESCSDLDAAVEAAERLRNVDSIERPRIFETNEIRYDFQPYYRINVVDRASGTAVGTAMQNDAAAMQNDAVAMQNDAVADSGSTAASAIDATTADARQSNGLFGDVPQPDADLAVDTGYEFSEEEHNVVVETEPTMDGAADAVSPVEPEVTTTQAPEVVPPDAPDAGIDDALSPEGAAGAAGAAGAVAAAAPKTGLFDKFVSSLEGKGSAAQNAAKSTTDGVGTDLGDIDTGSIDPGSIDPGETIDELTNDVNPRRGLFGR